MGIGSYKEAERYRMRTNKNLTRTFYLDTKRTLDEEPFAWEQSQDAGIMQPGITDPQFRQLELVEGGSVDRQEFGNGGRPAIGIAYERPDVLKIIKEKLKNSVEKKEGFKVVNWNEKTTHPMLIKEFKKNNIKLNNREFINKAITKVFEENNWIDPVQYRREMVVDSFMKHLDTVGEFDGEEKLAKELKPFLGEPATKNKPSKLYETINRDFKDWRAGKFEVSTVDRNALDKNALTEIKNWMPRTTNIRSVQRKEQLEFLNNLNDKNIPLDNAKNQFVKKFSNLENPLQTFNQRVGQLNVLKLEGKLPSNKDATQFKTYKNIEVGERAPWLKAGLTDLFAGNYSKTIQAADILNAEGKTKEAQRLYAAAEKFFSPNDGIFRKAGGQAEHPFSRKYGGTSDQQLKVNSLIQGDLNSFKKTNFDDPVNQAIEKYNISTDEKVKKSLQKEIELRKQFMNYITGSKEFGGIVDPVEFEFTPNEVKVKTNVKPIDKIKNFDVDVFKQRGEAYGKTASEIGKDLGLLTKEGEIANKKIGLKKLENILNVTPEEETAVKNVFNRLNTGVDPSQMSELAQQVYSKEINTVKNLVDRIPKPIKVAGKFFTFGDIALETIMALPRIASGDFEGAKRESLLGLFGYGKSLEEELLKVAKDPKTTDIGLKNLSYIPELKGLMQEKKDLEEKLFKDTTYDEGSSIAYQDLMTVNSRIKELQDYLSKNEYLEKNRDAVLQAIPILAKEITDRNIASKLGIKPAQGITPLQRLGFKDIQQKIAYDIAEELDLFNKMEIEDIEKVLGKKIKAGEPLTELPQDVETPVAETPVETQNETPAVKIPFIGNERVELKKGGMSKRGFLKLLGGTAATGAIAPDLIKAIKGGKKATQAGRVASKIKLEPAEGMYPWFPKLVEKVKEMGKPFEEKNLIMEPSYKNDPRPFGSRLPTGEEKLTKHVDGDTTFILREYPDGRLAVDIDSPRNQESFGQPVSLYYRPKMEIQNYKGEKKIEPAEFKVLEPEPTLFANGPDDVDITFTEVPKNPKRNTVFGDIEAAERFATGNIKNRKIIPVKQSLRNEMSDDPSTFIMRQSGELGSKAQPEEIIKSSEDIFKLPE
jgi:hypothetical protein